VPRDRLADGGRCGQCHLALFDGHPAALDGARFARHLEKSGVPLLIDFWATWCGPCRMMAPAYEKVAQRMEPDLRVTKLNTEDSQQIAAQYNIQSIPTLALFKDGKEVARKSGAMDAALIESWVKSKS